MEAPIHETQARKHIAKQCWCWCWGCPIAPGAGTHGLLAFQERGGAAAFQGAQLRLFFQVLLPSGYLGHVPWGICCGQGGRIAPPGSSVWEKGAWGKTQTHPKSQSAGRLASRTESRRADAGGGGDAAWVPPTKSVCELGCSFSPASLLGRRAARPAWLRLKAFRLVSPWFETVIRSGGGAGERAGGRPSVAPGGERTAEGGSEGGGRPAPSPHPATCRPTPCSFPAG